MFHEPSFWLVWKFGGTSVANADRLTAAANLVCARLKCSDFFANAGEGGATFPDLSEKEREGEAVPRLAVVVSAMKGVTSALESCCEEAAREFSRCQRMHGRQALYRFRVDAPDGSYEYQRLVNEIKQRHFQCADQLVAKNEMSKCHSEIFKANFERDIIQIVRILSSMSLSGTCPLTLKERVMGHGEIWASRLLYYILANRLKKRALGNGIKEEGVSYTVDQEDSTPTRSSVFRWSRCDFCPSLHSASSHLNAPHLLSPLERTVEEIGETESHLSCEGAVIRWIDAREILVTRDTSNLPQHEYHRTGGDPNKVLIHHPLSSRNLSEWLHAHPRCRLAVITGYVCSTKNKIPTTLQRNGSDYSGSLFASLLQAASYTVWTDVDGVHTADPRKVPDALQVPYLSYAEAIELAYFGAKVLHPLTMEPCITADIPILLRSSLAPHNLGTFIGSTSELTKRKLVDCFSANETNDPARPCRALTIVDNIALLSVTGTSMLRVPGMAARLFSAVHEADCHVVLTSQASSEHAISFAVEAPNAERARAAVEEAFYKEIVHDRRMRTTVTTPCAIICAVGEQMCGAFGVLGALATALAQAKVNVRAVAQGAAEMNIAFVVDSCDAQKALKAMHATFHQETLNVSESTQTFKNNDDEETTTTGGDDQSVETKEKTDGVGEAEAASETKLSGGESRGEVEELSLLFLVEPITDVNSSESYKAETEAGRIARELGPFAKVLGFTDGSLGTERLTDSTTDKEIKDFLQTRPKPVVVDLRKGKPEGARPSKCGDLNLTPLYYVAPPIIAEDKTEDTAEDAAEPVLCARRV